MVFAELPFIAIEVPLIAAKVVLASPMAYNNQ